MADKLKMNLSFPQYEKHIYDFVKSQPNPSAFIRKLIENYMNGNMIGGYTTPMQQQVVGYFNQLPVQFPTQPSLDEEKEDEIPDMIVDENGKIKIDLNEEVDGEAIDMIPI